MSRKGSRKARGQFGTPGRTARKRIDRQKARFTAKLAGFVPRIQAESDDAKKL